MKKIFFIISLLIFTQYKSFSQVDSSLMQKLTKPITNCETITTNTIAILPTLSFEKIDSIQKIIGIWENYCGKNEAIARLKILLMISKQENVDSITKQYLDNYMYIFESRNYYKTLKNNEDIELYNQSKDFFNYVPFNSNFELWIKTNSNNLKSKQQKHSNAYLFCLLFSDSLKAFYKAVNSIPYDVDNYAKNTINENNVSNLNIKTGLWIPTGKLANTFDPSLQLGFCLEYPLPKKLRLEIGFNIVALTNNNNFDINVENQNQSAKGSTYTVFGAYLAKPIIKYRRLEVESYSGIGYGSISTNVKKPSKENENYSICTANFSIGTNLNYKVFNNKMLTLNLLYNFIPYEWDKYISNNIGNQAISILLGLRF